jgi:hypothetical protein
MGSVHEVIEAFRTAPSNSERGTTFKKLMVRYFELDPTISQQYRSTSKHILRHISAPWNRHLEPARCRSRAYESEDQIDLRKGTNAQLRHRRHS